MKTTRMSITLGRTTNLGNFNSCRAEYTEEVEFGELDNADRKELRLELLERCEIGLRDAIVQAKKAGS